MPVSYLINTIVVLISTFSKCFPGMTTLIWALTSAKVNHNGVAIRTWVHSFCTHGLTLIPAWINNHKHSKVWVKLLIPSQTSAVPPSQWCQAKWRLQLQAACQHPVQTNNKNTEAPYHLSFSVESREDRRLILIRTSNDERAVLGHHFVS